MCLLRRTKSRGGAEVARLAHNQKVSGSNPLPATMEEYNEIPVYYCRDCLSLKVGSVHTYDTLDYCMDCGSTNVEVTNIHDWESLYENKYKHKFLDNGRAKVH